MDETLRLFIDTVFKEQKAIREKEIPELREDNRKHEQTLYGENGENGLKGDMKEVKKSIRALQKLSWMILGGLLVLSAGVFWKIFFAIK